MASTKTSAVSQKAQKRPLSFEEQLLAADQAILKKAKAIKKVTVACTIPATVSSKCSQPPEVKDTFHDPTTGRKRGHCAGLGQPTSSKPRVSLRDRTVRELEMLFSFNKDLREKEDQVWESVTRREFGLKLEKKPDESWYEYFKRTETAEEARLADLAARISAKQIQKQAKEKKTLKCSEVRPIARRSSSHQSRAAPSTVGSLEKKAVVKPEKKNGPTPLMKKAMKMAKAMRR
ncbi:unnamed protein product [Bursaphelenchus xylophilus]|uniref:(pine wood nematode) hypothetical protein n=1 Tax=Bursaphelenchus xylophilus TaxID=6326 RepID=A0A1I7RP71_BURXY|nr:unnamed protein product [Bursaphelenchus xylophilus]CAG9124626.1 unnamed protein product [Bursaphelenchus xylophilus]